MNEELELLTWKASQDDLSEEERVRWDVLCQADPSLRQMEADFRVIHDRLRALAGSPQEDSDMDASMPDAIFRQWQAMGREAFGEYTHAETRDRRSFGGNAWWHKMVEHIQDLLGSHGPLLAAATAVVVLAVSWGLFRSDRQPGPIVATIKEAVISPDLPIASPGEETLLLDPPAIWVSLDPTPLEISIRTADGVTELFRAESVKPPVHWKQFTASMPEVSALEPEEKYLFRFDRGNVRSERVVSVSTDARPLAAWATVGPDEGKALIDAWLTQGRAADALALAGALSSLHPEASFSELRGKALKMALESAPQPRENEK